MMVTFHPLGVGDVKTSIESMAQASQVAGTRQHTSAGVRVAARVLCDRFEMDENPRFFELAGNVRAMLRLRRDRLPDELLFKVLNAGVQAPSGMNSQPWSLLVIRSPEDMQWSADHYKAAIELRMGGRVPEGDEKFPLARQFRALHYQMDHMHEFPLLLVVCGLRDWPFKVPEAERVGLAPPNFGALYPSLSLLQAEWPPPGPAPLLGAPTA
jgi:nitroreductase